MGLFGLFGSKEPSEKGEQKQMPWKQLTSSDQLENLSESSKTRPVVIFKHSTRCGISSMVLRQFERSYDLAENQADLYFLDLIRFREVSNEVAARFQVWHQSPQMIVIRNGGAVHDASHNGIHASKLHQFI